MIHLGIVLEHAGRRQELDLVDVDESTLGSSLYELIARRLQLAPDSFWLSRVDVGDQIVRDRSIGEHRLIQGECLKVESGSAPQAATVERSVEVHVTAGPHVGESFGFKSSFEIGRKAILGGLTLDRDDQCSSRNAVVRFTPSGIEIEDLRSTNGTQINGTTISGPTYLRDGQDVVVGRSTLRFRVRAGLHEAAHLRYSNGRLLLNRPARVQRKRPAEVIDIPRPPDSPARRRLPKAMIIGPALLGIPSYLITKSPIALVMMLGSPLLALFSWFDDRTSGRKDFGKKSVEYTARLDQISIEIDAANHRSVVWRTERNPGVPEVLMRAAQRSPDLWQRDNNDSDFLEIRVARKALPSLVAVRVPGDGDEGLRGEIAGRTRPERFDDGAPVVVPIGQTTDPSNRSTAASDVVDVVAVVGSPGATDPLVRWLICQLAVHHSPQDLALGVAMPSRGPLWAWTRWLPHVEQITSDDELTVMVASNDSQASRLVKNVAELAVNRVEASKDSYASDVRFQPHVCVVAELPVRIPVSEFTTFLEQLPTANMSTLLVAHDRRMVPRQADVIITVDDDGSVTTEFVRTDVEIAHAAGEGITLEQADSLARSLAPLKDDSTALHGGSSIPARVNLLEMLDMSPLTTELIERRWATPRKGISAPIGIGGSGILELELSPHGLVGGTTGAGKSEFLQTYVASLALTYPPERLNFVLVDFKGGLAFNECINLPHAVGLITNLDPHLAERVMQSLQAELNERTRIMNELRAEAARKKSNLGGADLSTLAREFPDKCPPELVIVFDEFKEAVEKVPTRPNEPSFIDRVMSLARLGRQVGMHVILATQTPEGVVTEDLKNNIDLRVALRVKTTDASRSILDRPDAALIAKRFPGRGFAQLEAGDTREFQSAYVGGQSAVASSKAPDPALMTSLFGNNAQRRAAAIDADRQQPSVGTDLQQILDVVSALYQRRGARPQSQPWKPELPGVIHIRDLLEGWEAREGGGRRFVIPVGLSDQPAAQRQDWYGLDMERLGSLLVYGATGSGKSSLLRTAAVAAALSWSPQDLHIYALDFSGQSLAALKALPHCAAAVTGREIDRVRQVVARLQAVLQERQALLEEHGVGTISELRQRGIVVPRVLILLDGFQQFFDVFEERYSDPLYPTMLELIESGRSADIFTILTTSRATLSHLVTGAVPGRIVMRMNNPDDYSTLGLRELSGLSVFPAGRGFTESAVEVQFAVNLLDDFNVEVGQVEVGDENAAIRSFGERMPTRWGRQAAPQLRSLPKELWLDSLPAAAVGDRRMAIGVDEVNVEPVFVSFERTPSFLVIGPEQSGKTSVASVMAVQFRRAFPDAELIVLSGKPHPLGRTESIRNIAGQSDVIEFLRPMKAEIARWEAEGTAQPAMWVFDEADSLLVNDTISDVLNSSHLQWRGANLMVVATLSASAAERYYQAWFRSAQSAKQGLLLTPTDLATNGNLLGEKLPSRSRLELVAGRGFLQTRQGYQLVQCAALAPKS